MTIKPGTLYGIGVGPGDPDLLTVKAIHVLQKVDIVYTAASTKNDYSLAVNIARAHIPAETEIRTLAFPMTKDRHATHQAWEANARTIAAVTAAGRQAAFLTLGDPLTFSTFGYILKYMRRLFPDLPVVTVPGITAYQASAAALNMPLVEGEQSLLVVSGAYGGNRLAGQIEKPDTVVFMKAYRNVNGICAALENADMLAHSAGVVRCSLPEQEIVADVKTLESRSPNYWTLIIARKTDPYAPQEE
ncbi:MAG: precorrin-2 C(20)-methyltransferase [Desulfobacterales bacterium]|nr:precorrin-2 C(20)-methyltransferase [Desulfobacterales bacterium]